MLLETAVAKVALLTSGVLLLFAGSAGVGSDTLGLLGLAQGAEPVSMFERIAPNFALGALGMWLIYRLAIKSIADLSARIDDLTREVRDDKRNK